jgi:exo-beta-1,3-glucanase (GH17 family)
MGASAFARVRTLFRPRICLYAGILVIGLPTTAMPGVSISLTPLSATLQASQTETFTASIRGTSRRGVTWTLSPNAGTISATGFYTAPAAIAAALPVTVTATSVADPKLLASATVSLLPSQSETFPAAVNAPPTVSYGMASGLWTVDNANIDYRISKLRSLGATITSSVMAWNAIEGNQGVRNWANPDYWVEALVENAIEPVAVMLFAPTWANASTDPLQVPYDTTNHMPNGGFEDDPPGSVVMWTQNIGHGAVSDELVNVHSGKHAVKLTSGTIPDTFIRQSVPVNADTGYSLRYYAANQAERYQVIDNTHGANIVSLTSGGNWGPSYQQKVVSFRTPVGCSEIEVYFYSPATQSADVYLDDVQLLEMTGPIFQEWKAAYISFVRDAATRYTGRIHKWEVWNEPNLVDFWHPVPDVQQYIELYTGAAEAIHSIDATAQVSVQIGALQGASDEPRGDTFLQQIYDAHVDVDVVSFHAYTLGMAAPPTVTGAYNNFDDVTAIRAVMIANGMSDKNMWITEFGWPTDRVSPSQQASYLGTALGMIRDDYSSYVSVALVYQLMDAGDYFGLYTADGTAKPAADVVAAFLQH